MTFEITILQIPLVLQLPYSILANSHENQYLFFQVFSLVLILMYKYIIYKKEYNRLCTSTTAH